MIRSPRFLVPVLTVAVFGCQSVPNSPAPPPPNEQGQTVGIATAPPVDAAELDTMIRRVVAEQHLVGLSVGVARDGKIILAKGYGLAATGTTDSVTPETMFGVGSVTKQFTCSALMLLAEEGKLSLSDPVAKWYPKLTRAKDITLLELGQHVSGYRDYYPLDYVDREMLKNAATDQVIEEYATRPLDFEPGSRWSYSNTNFLILGQVIEKVSGKPFAAVLGERIFEPLGLRHTKYGPARGGPGMATGYTAFALGDPIPATPEGEGWVGSAGAIWSTPTDLLTWDLGLIDGKVLKPESYRTLTTARRLTDGRSTGYGCGEGVNDRGDAVVLSHGGAVSGFVAQNTVIPATRSAVVLLANTDFAAIGALNAALVAKLTPRVDAPVVAGRSALEAATGFLTGLAQGKVDRATLSPDFDAFLSPDLVAAGRKSLGTHGPISGVEVGRPTERGGMEVVSVRFKAGPTPAHALMYRSPDGKIEEFLISR